MYLFIIIAQYKKCLLLKNNDYLINRFIQKFKKELIIIKRRKENDNSLISTSFEVRFQET